jgi:hypothetical protein
VDPLELALLPAPQEQLPGDPSRYEDQQNE